MNSFDGVVVYCDGSARPNPGFIGLGAHGYFYNESDREFIIEDNILTDQGYISYNTVSKDAVKVEPMLYMDYFKSVSHLGSNNKAEVLCFKEMLIHLLEYKLNKAFFLCDSEYVVRGVNEWCKNWERNNWKRLYRDWETDRKSVV